MSSTSSRPRRAEAHRPEQRGTNTHLDVELLVRRHADGMEEGEVRHRREQGGKELLSGVGNRRVWEGTTSGRSFASQSGVMASGFCPTDERGAAAGDAALALGGCRVAEELAVGGWERGIKGSS